ncbi:MAG: GNAT family N-acetyltransferase [Clostridia bacterium]|nr:GNAT family N-acetyltransferase [Clostridia bacterium]
MIRKATYNDCRILAELAVQMWEDNTVDSLEAEFSESIKTDDAVFFIKYENETPVGFAQCGLRKDYVEGTETSPVGYLEGIFVKKPYRNKGYAKELLSACEKWARDMGCTEFASDCELDNVGSLKFHVAMGFEEVNRIICFRKGL